MIMVALEVLFLRGSFSMVIILGRVDFFAS